MKRATYFASLTIAAFSLLLGIAGMPARAGEAGQVKIPTAPILYYACMSTGAHTEYDSAIFEAANDTFNARRTPFAYAAHLSQTYKFVGGRVATDWVYKP